MSFNSLSSNNPEEVDSVHHKDVRVDRGRHSDLSPGSTYAVDKRDLIAVPRDYIQSQESRLRQKGFQLIERYSATSDAGVLEEAVQVAREAFHIDPDPSLEQATLFNALSLQWNTIYSKNGEANHLDKAIQLARDAVLVAPKSHPNRSALLTNLGIQIFRRYQKFSSIEDIEEAAEIAREARDATPETDSHWGARQEILRRRMNERDIKLKAMADTGEAMRNKDAGSTEPRDFEAEVKGLIAQGKLDDEDKRGRTPLLEAAINGSALLVQLLLDTGKVDVEKRDENGWTALFWAASNGAYDVAKLLIETGKAHTGITDKFGQTPLFYAKTKGHSPMVELLQEKQSTKLKHTPNNNQVTETERNDDGKEIDGRFAFIPEFATRLVQDVNDISEPFDISEVTFSYLDCALSRFIWALHAESPEYWELCVVLRKRQTEIIQILLPGKKKGSQLDDVNKASSSPGVKHNQTTPSEQISGNSRKEYSLLGIAMKLILEGAFESSAYKWLLTKIRQYDILTFGSPDTMSIISSQFEHKINELSSLVMVESVSMSYKVDWNPRQLLVGLGFTNSSSLNPSDVLCMTGSPSEAQVATVADYFKQTWPNTGESLLRLLEMLVSYEEGDECAYQPQGKEAVCLSARIQPLNSCQVEVTGGFFHICEISEQIAWISSALRTVPADLVGVVICSPRFEDLTVSIDPRHLGGPKASGHCHLKFAFQRSDKTYGEQGGLCWDRLFCNPIVVGGYPILRRQEPNLGLEIPLDTLAYLIQSNHLVQWGDKILIKGFNMMCFGVAVLSGVLVWHLIQSEDPGERISYNDFRTDKLALEIPNSLRKLIGMRHIVGWCSNATDHCGNVAIDKDVSTCNLPTEPPSFVFERLYIEAGSQLVVGALATPNKKREGVWMGYRENYPSMLDAITLQPIVFFDVAESRAWLIDGASALLHLVRLSLHRNEKQADSPYEWLFDNSQLKENWNGFSARSSAIKTLKDQENKNLKLYLIDTQLDRHGNHVPVYSTFESRVKQIADSIEILADWQEKATSRDGVSFLQTINRRNAIIGFDVLDIIAPSNAVYGRIKYLGSWSRGWTDLIPAMKAVTIFGNGFGDLISANDTSVLCRHWKSIPIGKEYMAASVSTLKMLYEERVPRVAPGLSPGEMAKDVRWKSVHHPFKTCDCVNGDIPEGSRHLDPTQLLVTKKMEKLKRVPHGAKSIGLATLDVNGAVIFGHSSLLGRKDEATFERNTGHDDGLSSIGESSGSQGTAGISAVDSSDLQPSTSTAITSPSTEFSNQMGVEESERPANIGNGQGRLEWMRRIFNKFRHRRSAP